jgi:type IV secretory pathway TrbF-like protein
LEVPQRAERAQFATLVRTPRRRYVNRAKSWKSRIASARFQRKLGVFIALRANRPLTLIKAIRIELSTLIKLIPINP